MGENLCECVVCGKSIELNDKGQDRLEELYLWSLCNEIRHQAKEDEKKLR